MTEELLSLKWNNHQSHFVDILTFLREQEIFIDATLACGGKLYPAHKFVLSTCSDYFKQMFTKNPNKHPIVFMKDVTCRDLEALLDFMYNGEVNVPQSSLGSLIKTAEGLQIKGLAVPDDPPAPKRDVNIRERRDVKVSRDNSYSPPPKRLRAREKSPHLISSAPAYPSATLPRARSPTSILPNVTTGLLPIEASVDEDSRTSAQSALSEHSLSLNSKPNLNNQSHYNNDDSTSQSDNLMNQPSNKEPSPGPSGLHKPTQSKEEEVEIKQEDVVDLGQTDEGDWGGGGEGDGSMDDGGGDSLTSENAPNFSDVLMPPSDGALNTTGDPAMRNGVNGGGARVIARNELVSDPAGGDSLPYSQDLPLPLMAGPSSTQVSPGTPPSIASLGLDVSPSMYRFLLESSSAMGNGAGSPGSSSSNNASGLCRSKFPASFSTASSTSLSVTHVPLSFEDTEQRPFPCKFCDARFKKKQHLQNHERIHTGEKYMCILCGQGFSRLHILKHHVGRKHNVPDSSSSSPSSSVVPLN